MGEWDYQYFKLKKPRVSDDDSGVRVASTTDRQRDVDIALHGDHPRYGDDDVVVSVSEPGTQEADGSTESGTVTTYTGSTVSAKSIANREPSHVNGEEVTYGDGPEVYVPAPRAQFSYELDALLKQMPEVDEAMSDQVEIPPEADAYLRGTPTGPLLAIELAKHRAKIDELWALPEGQPRLRKLRDWTVKLGYGGVDPDKMSHRQYRNWRDQNKWR